MTAPPRALELEALTPRVDAWLQRAVARQAPLEFRDLRKGVQALSTRYVERRGDARVLAKALDGPARRAAFATYYAALHLVEAFLAGRRAAGWGGIERILDLGAGTGAAGFGVALALRSIPRVDAFDRSGWALAEARQAGRDLGVPIRTRRQDLARGLPRMGKGDAVVSGWFLNELAPDVRDEAVEAIARGIESGARLLVLEPLAGAAAPWWEEVAARLGFAPDGQIRERVALPAWVREMDRAAGLDHSELRVRVMGHVS